MFKFEYHNEIDDRRITMELGESDLTHDRVAEYFTDFLRGCSYVFNHYSQYRLVHDDGTVEPSFEEKYEKIMEAAEKLNEEDRSTFPVI